MRSIHIMSHSVDPLQSLSETRRTDYVTRVALLDSCRFGLPVPEESK